MAMSTDLSTMQGATDGVPAARGARRHPLRRLLHEPKGLIGLAIVGLFALLAIGGPWLAPLDPYAQNFARTLRPPSAEHWFGTDQLGRDVFSRVLTGARTSLGIGIGGVLVALLFGVPIGMLAAFRGGRVDFLIMRGVDIMLSFPDIVFALAIVAILGPSTQNVIHLAFNDPPADFDTEEPYIVVTLDEACRRQQLGEGWFPTFEDVPQRAISMSIRQIMKSRLLVVSVPDARKAEAVRHAVEGPVSPQYPASILQQHPACRLFLDEASAAGLKGRPGE
jgi:ABC-type dipeptide/oligopeptide/nickel transport systems, permease components